ncbi:MAG: methylmalonyl-CoA mutase family protein [Thermoplasmata archaeon]|nr:methylmalonyl-CoA mutase family protein [Thermoplasmata archaeon]
MGSDREQAPARTRWEKAARSAIGERVDGGAVPLLVTPDPNANADYAERIGFPGEYPFTRGVQPTMYRGRLWTYRQYSGYGSARSTNQRFRYLLAEGQTGLSVAFDLPTQLGLDPDHAKAKGEVGRVGVPIATLGDMHALFDKIPLEKATVSMTINATAPILTALLLAVGESQGLPRARLSGTVQNDILKEYIARGTYIYPPAASVRLATDLVEFATREMPGWNFMSVSGYHMREAGATAVQELAFTVANAIAYVRAAVARGLAVDAFLPRLSFFFSSDRNFLEEIAKFRAARRLWASVARDVLGAKSPKALQLRFHTQTAGSSLTAHQPELNVVRTTLEALAAVLGGTQSLHTNAFDEALGLPTEEAAGLALRTQQILAEESGIASTVDPLGGAYEIEELTDRIEDGARTYLDRIEALGGAIPAVESGYFSSEIAKEAYRKARARESGEEVTVGVNTFPENNPKFTLFPARGTSGIKALRVSPKEEARQRRAVVAWRRRRDARRAEEALSALRKTTESGGNVMPAVVAAIVAGATLGEIAGTWRDLFGEYRPPAAF